ncbi:amidase family protein [Temperatibacter marinus]|uniref:Amidase family protein n=1 Tax=Temperatibacter marinus TaxID=1456591 RepID=A0AA52EL60_9PROT|nr:amidase family protein [Temperatibacter marinus]WND04031.1 amidase family protein [Temperatibacter marinus]
MNSVATERVLLKLKRLVLVMILAMFGLYSFQTHANDLSLTAATIKELNKAMDEGKLSSEKLVKLFQARIAAFDKKGPAINAILTLNEKALSQAIALDEERRTKGRRSPLHGIPILLKDNLDTFDMPTTAGSFLLEGSYPPDDAFIVKKLRDAGAIILAKANMSELASGGPMSSLGGSTYNPHDINRSPSGSSGGSGASVAAAFGMMALGTDTGGSVRGPSSANGIVGLKTTHGLLSRDGVIPLALSFDTVGPMARSVYDVAVSLGIMTGVDSADISTDKSKDKFHTDYTQFLDANALIGAKIGVARIFMGNDYEVDWVMESALKNMKDAGAEIIDIKIPSWVIDVRGRLYRAIRYPEFKAQIKEYLATTGEGYPKSLDDLIARQMGLISRRADGVIPNPGRWELMLYENKSTDLTGYEYNSVLTHGLPLIRSVLDGLMKENGLDAIVYPTSTTRPAKVDMDPTSSSGPGGGPSPVSLANLSGFPDLIVPAGFTGRGLPVSISFLGTAFSEPRLLGLGYAFEQRTKALRLPAHTPVLEGEVITN